MNYRPPAHIREMLEALAKEDRTHLSWELNWLIEQEWQRRGKPPILAGAEEGDDAPTD